MWFTLTVDGLPVGRVDLTNAPRAIGPLLALPAFETTGLRTVARRLGLALRVIGAHSVTSPVAARALAGPAPVHDTPRPPGACGAADDRFLH